jgi:predicted TIM-barrel fold metal-dependent hydrolase
MTMRRRDFIKNAAVGAGLTGTGMFSGPAEAAVRRRRSAVNFHRIDSYCHFSPLEYIDLLETLNAPTPSPNSQRAINQAINSQRAITQPIKALWDVAARLQVMDETGINVSIVVPQPFIEMAPNIARDPAKALQAATFINDRMAEIVAQHPDRFKWVALLPTNLPADIPPSTSNYDLMIAEFERALGNGAVGACFTVSPMTKPPDHEDYVGNPSTGKQGLFGKAASLNVPLWMHPCRPPVYPDYTSDVPPLSKCNLFLQLGWLHDTSVAMARIVFANVFGNNPKVKIICHHKGALVPIFQNRLTYELNIETGVNTAGIPANISKPYLDHFRNFYVDTVFSGNTNSETEILKIVYDFFGSDHILFGTDAAFGTHGGRDGIRRARFSVEGLNVPRKQIANIFSNNILKITPH